MNSGIPEDFLDGIHLVQYTEVKDPDWTADLYVPDETQLIVNNKGNVVAEVVLMTCVDVATIDNIEIRYKNIGHGRAVIDYLKELLRKENYKVIIGESVPEAIYFWVNMGAEFCNEIDEVLCFEENLLSSFEIKL